MHPLASCSASTNRRSASQHRLQSLRGPAWLAALLVGLTPSLEHLRAADPAPAASAPQITSITPTEIAAGMQVTVRGSGFAEGDVLKLDSLTLPIEQVSATQITATIPAKAKVGKKLLLQRSKKTATDLRAGDETFVFVAAPKISSVSPSFAVPGDTVTIKGTQLAAVKSVRLGEATLKLDSQTATQLRFVVPQGLRTGPLAVSSVGGTATRAKDYEIFYPPQLTSAAPTAGFEGDAVTVKGAYLDGSVKFKLGSKSLKTSEQTANAATMTIAKGAKTGSLTATARKKTGTLASPITVHPTPALTSVPKEVGAPGELKVTGKNLTAVSAWRLGAVNLAPVQAASATKVTLAIPADAPTDQLLVAVSQGREFASKAAVATVRTPTLHGLAFWPAATGKGVEGTIRGEDFSSKTKFTFAGKSLKTTFVAPDRVTFVLTKAPTAASPKLTAKAGKYNGLPLTLDGATAGYQAPSTALAGQLQTGASGYSLAAAQLDLEASEGLHRAVVAAATKTPKVSEVARLGLQVAHDVQRMAIAQAAVCTGMAAGKAKAQVAANSRAGEVLRQSTQHSQALVAALEPLWATLTPETLASAGLTEVDAAIAAAAAVQPKLQAACKGRFHGSGQLATDAATTIKLDLGKLYQAPMRAAFAGVLAGGKNWTAVEKTVQQQLAPLPASRRNVWLGVLKASKSGVEAEQKTGTTGKGATGDKNVNPKGKPKSTGKK